MSEAEYLAHHRAAQAARRRADAEREVADAGLWAPLAPHNGTATSKAAAAALSTADSDRWRILQYIVDCGDRGATRDELVIHFNTTERPIGGDTIRPRVWECIEPKEVLKRYGSPEPLLATPGHKRKTQRGCESFVLVATLAGIRVAAEHGRTARAA